MAALGDIIGDSPPKILLLLLLVVVASQFPQFPIKGGTTVVAVITATDNTATATATILEIESSWGIRAVQYYYSKCTAAIFPHFKLHHRKSSTKIKSMVSFLAGFEWESINQFDKRKMSCVAYLIPSRDPARLHNQRKSTAWLLHNYYIESRNSIRREWINEHITRTKLIIFIFRFIVDEALFLNSISFYKGRLWYQTNLVQIGTPFRTATGTFREMTILPRLKLFPSTVEKFRRKQQVFKSCVHPKFRSTEKFKQKNHRGTWETKIAN